ncbi:MAG: hypothetical protein LBQ61_10510, partial [Spirochaetales bacterium]|nr:hypothetical protein [Spirochaetales bacterium]
MTSKGIFAGLLVLLLCFSGCRTNDQSGGVQIYQGIGIHTSGRVGPGADDTGVPVYGINQVAANVLFDENGKILALYIDQLEVVTPNYDG